MRSKIDIHRDSLVVVAAATNAIPVSDTRNDNTPDAKTHPGHIEFPIAPPARLPYNPYSQNQ